VLAAHRFAGKGRDNRFADRDEVCARPLDADALAADAGAFQQQPQRVGEQIGFGDPGVPAEPGEAVALFRLEFLNDVSRRMIAFGELDRHIGHVAAAPIVANAFAANTNKGMELRERVAGIILLESAPDRISLASHLVQTSNDQIILRAEVTIERHFVGVCGFRDGVNADPSDPVFAKEISCGADDSLSRFQWDHAGLHHGSILLPPLRLKKKCRDVLDKV
jgi:hypothetical protein